MNESATDLTQRDWRTLVRTIEKGTCILLLGPDVALDPDNPERGPLTEALAKKLSSELAGGESPVDEANLSHVALLYYQHFLDRVGLEEDVEKFYASYSKRYTDFHRDLAALPFRLCINTTPDRFLYNAFLAAGKAPIYDYYDFRNTRPSFLKETKPDKPIVYDLYGSCVDSASLVLTEHELLEFLVNIVKGTPPLPKFITSQFADPYTSFLFLGFGFHNWYVRILLHLLQTYRHKQYSLALEEARFFSDSALSRTIVFYKNEHFIKFRKLSCADFATRLRQHYEEQAEHPTPPPASLPDDAPNAFLCHCSADREEVEKVEQRLHELGIKTWRDRQNLRGGDDWERCIPQVINKQVDYVVILQSPTMMGRVESYFNVEIDEALKRQRKFADEFRFVLPTFLNPCKGFEKLEKLHSTNLTTEDGVRALADSIREDWHKRSQRPRESQAETVE